MTVQLEQLEQKYDWNNWNNWNRTTGTEGKTDSGPSADASSFFGGGSEEGTPETTSTEGSN